MAILFELWKRRRSSEIPPPLDGSPLCKRGVGAISIRESATAHLGNMDGGANIMA